MTLKKIAFAAAAAALAALISGCGRAKVDFNDYLTLECDGYDTVGYADYNFDYERMVNENLQAFGLSENAGEMEEMGVYLLIEDYVSGKLDKTDELSNGDTVTYEWDVNDERLEEVFPIKVTHDNKTLEISGLKEAETFDPFQNLKVTFTGIAPKGEVSISGESGEVSGLNYTADKNTGLSNGDKITVSVDTSSGDINDYCMKYGLIPSVTEKEYTVEGLSSYAATFEDIPEDIRNKMDTNAQDTLKAYVAGKWADPKTFKGMKLIGNYFIYPKDSSLNVSVNNYVYFVYKVTALNKDDDNKEFSYYYYSYYTDVMPLDDGTCSYDLSSMSTPTSSDWFSSGDSFSTGNYRYYGYQDLDSLFSKQVTAKIDKYRYESTVKDK